VSQDQPVRPTPKNPSADDLRREIAEIDSQLDEVESFRMPLMEHLVELKDRLIVAIIAVGVGVAISLFFAENLYEWLKAPFDQALATKDDVKGGLSLVSSPFEGIYTYLRVGIIGGLVLALPVVSYQIWSFVAPGLYKTERNVVLPLTVTSVFLFFLGGAFCYYAIFPYAFVFFIDVLPLDVNLSAGGYLGSVLRMMLAFGVCFQLPVVSWFLARMGMIDHIDMAKAFRYAIVVIFFIAAMITPPDPLTQVLLGIPMVLLYALGMLIARITTTKVRED